MVKSKQLNFRVDETTKQDLEDIIKELNKNSSKKISLSYILEDYINCYYSTSPHGLKLENRHLKQELNEKKEQLIKLNDEITQIKSKIQTNEEIINNTNLYDISNYKNNENVLKAIESLKEYVKHKEQYIKLTDIPKRDIEGVAIQHKVPVSDLIKIIEFNFKNWEK